MSLVIRSMMLLQADARNERRAAVGQGGDKLKALSKRREMNRKSIEQRGERADELSEELSEINNKNWFLKGVDTVFGQDPAGAVNEKQTENQAGIEQAQAELEVMRNDQKSIFREIERAEQNFSSVEGEASQMLKKRERTVRDSEL